jgi:hypothetical protein
MFEPQPHPQPHGNTSRGIALWISDYQDALDKANARIQYVCIAGGWCSAEDTEDR